MRLALDKKEEYARKLLADLAPQLGNDLVQEVLTAGQDTEEALHLHRQRIEQLRHHLVALDAPEARELESVIDVLARRSVWIVGGDGWAYDIGFGGLDHVLASGRDVNLLVLDTEVYSNTGGQASKSTPRAAVAKFASGGKPICKKDLGMLAMAYGNVYVAQVAIGANPTQTVRTFLEADAYRGPSLIIAYSHCIAHGVNMSTAMTHQKDAVLSGYWPLYHYDPRRAQAGQKPLRLDSRKPSRKFKDFASEEARFGMLARSNPKHAEHLMELAQRDIDVRWHYYEQMVDVVRTVPEPDGEDNKGDKEGKNKDKEEPAE
jgi:pyruvate-ferredoxin/flavodoxin oxidoreductase